MDTTLRRNIVLTGVSQGLGLAMAEELIAAGHVVFGCARSEAKLRTLRVRFPAPHQFDTVNVADDEAVLAWAKAVFEQAGHVDLVINNAALMNRLAPLWDISEQEFAKLMDVNVAGTVNVIRHFVPRMVSRGIGVIVNFSSGWGRSASPEVAPYCASKWAIEGLTRAMAQELPRGMAAVALDPGTIDTPMLRGAWSQVAAMSQKSEAWATRAVPYILSLDAQDSGEPRKVPKD